MDIEITNLSLALVILVAAVILAWLAGILLKFLRKRFVAQTTTTFDDVIIDAASRPAQIAIVVAGTQLALHQLEFIPANWLESFADFFFVVYLLLIYVATYRLTTGLADWYGTEVVSKTDTELDDKFLTFFRALANIIVASIIIIILLGPFGIEPSALVTTLGIGTLAVALAAQETLSDIIAGFMIMLDQPFAIGDRVELQEINTWGDVTEIGLRSTRILTRDNRMVTVPNSVIGKGLVVNYSDPSTVYRVQTHIGIAYGTDVDHARQLMVSALAAEDWVMKNRPVEALLLEFGESALVFRVRCWIEDYMETRRVIDKMNSSLYQALNRESIAIPMPQRDIFIRDRRLVAETADESLPDAN
jgi:small-conductance mechanosensitive channel